MGKDLRVGVLGGGTIAGFHIESYQRCEGVSVVAVSDVVEDRARSLAERYKIPKFFKDYRDILKISDVDAVSVCTPNFLHCEMTVAALRAGKHVLCEKPMAMNAREGQKMCDEAKRAGKILMMGFCNRFRPESMALKKLIESGRLGEIYHSQVFAMRRRGIPGLGSWFTTKSKSGGGPLIDIGVHMLDLTLWLIGWPKPKRVSATTYSKFGGRDDYTCIGMWGIPEPGGPFDVEDYVSAFIRFENNTTMHLECSWAANIGSDRMGSTILGDEGGADISLGKPLQLYGQSDGFLTDTTPHYPTAGINIYHEEAAHFVECVREGKEPMATGPQGLIVQKVIDAIYRSSEEGREVDVG
ncbi:MAG: Gfo/Idh/MocA family protein [bacterium]